MCGMHMASDRWRALLRSPLLVLVLAGMALAAGIGMREPSPPDEPRFVLAARHMVESGDWLLPHRGSELYGHKPPPFMWAQAASFLVVRDWRVAFLLPSLLAGLGTLWLVWDAARRLWNRRIAGYAALALLVTLQFGLQAKRAQIDMLLVLLTTLSLWAFLRALLVAPRPALLGLAGFAAGLGTVTKGVGFLPLLALLPALWAARRPVAWSTQLRAHRLPGRAYGWVLLCFVGGTAVWLLPLLIGLGSSDDPQLRAYAGEILLRQTAQRYANPWHHHQPSWYYLQAMLTLWLPGVLLLPWLLPAWWRRLRRRDPRQIVLLGWSVLVLLFFTMSPAKREVYIFPALPALCLAAAPLLPGLLRRRGVRVLLLGYLLLLATLLTVTGLLGTLGVGRWPARLLADPQFAMADVAAVWRWLLAAGVIGLLAAALGRQRRIGPAVLTFTLGLWVVYGIGLMPALSPASSASAMMAAVGVRIGPDAELGLLGWREQHLLQADRPARDFGFERPWREQWPDAARWLAQSPERRWLLMLADLRNPCVDESKVLAAGRSNRRDWLLLPGSAVVAGCVPPPTVQESIPQGED
jgi:4-amino-4-deoxy-L-arabinose transferase-like glycosyltransferase